MTKLDTYGGKKLSPEFKKKLLAESLQNTRNSLGALVKDGIISKKHTVGFALYKMDRKILELLKESQGKK